MKPQTPKIVFGAIAALAVIGIIYAFAHTAKKVTPAVTISDPSSLGGLQTTRTAWSAESNHLRERLAAINLPALSKEGEALHIHSHLDILVGGRKVSIPANIGIDNTFGFIAPLHTHDANGVIHVESPTVQDFTLGQFFDVWGVKLTAHCVGGYCDSTYNTALKVFVNGAVYTGDPRLLVLDEHQEIFIAYGTASELPEIESIPSSYTFSRDE